MAHLHGQGPVAAGGATSIIFTSSGPHRPGDRARDNDGNEYMFVDYTATVYYGCLVQINSINQAAPLLGTASRPYRVGVVCGGTAVSTAGAHPTSDSSGWVQIYGVHPAVQTGAASDGGVSATAGGAYLCMPQTSVGTPSGVLAISVAQPVAVSIVNTSTEVNRIFGMWVVDFAEVTDLTTWPGASGSSGPSSNNDTSSGVTGIGGTSGAATSAFIGQTYAVYMNYPYVTGISEPFTDADSDT